jgi:hypothetical protein
MLVTFTCKEHENIMMFGDIALKLIKMMGHSGVVPGAIQADEVPHALILLRGAIEEEKKHPFVVSDESVDDRDDAPVSLAHRAFPLLDLLEDAVKKRCDVLWS